MPRRGPELRRDQRRSWKAWQASERCGVVSGGDVLSEPAAAAPRPTSASRRRCCFGSGRSTHGHLSSPPRARAAAGVRLARRVVDARQVPLAVRPGTCAIISDPIMQLTYIRTSGSLSISFLELSDHRMKDDLLRSDLHPLPVPSSHASESACIPGATRPGALTSPCVDCTRPRRHWGDATTCASSQREPAGWLITLPGPTRPLPRDPRERLASPRRPPRRFATDRSRRHVFAARVDH